jgi:hypothetical protein
MEKAPESATPVLLIKSWSSDRPTPVHSLILNKQDTLNAMAQAPQWEIH